MDDVREVQKVLEDAASVVGSRGWCHAGWALYFLEVLDDRLTRHGLESDRILGAVEGCLQERLVTGNWRSIC